MSSSFNCSEMSYRRRSRRLCHEPPKTYSKNYEATDIPDSGDEILVNWDVDGKNIRWKAPVLSSSISHAPPVIGKGFISYEPYDKYKT